MKFYTLALLIFSAIGCIHQKDRHPSNESEKKELIIDTKVLRSLHDSLNRTGDSQYYKKYILKIDEMIKKYPDQKELLKVKKSMNEIFGDSL